MRGKPKYTYGDWVRFRCDNKYKEGRIAIIDAYGTFFNPEDVSYDIYVPEENCLYKHFQEKYVEFLRHDTTKVEI